MGRNIKNVGREIILGHTWSKEILKEWRGVEVAKNLLCQPTHVLNIGDDAIKRILT